MLKAVRGIEKAYVFGYNLERKLKRYDTAILDALLPAVCFCEHGGYKTVGHGVYELENDVKLVYEIMEKKQKID